MKKMYQAGEFPKESGLYHLVHVIEQKVEATMQRVVVYVGPHQKLPNIDAEGYAWMKA